MFEPVRTIKCCSYIPQTERLPLLDGVKIKYGCALSLVDGHLTVYCGQGIPDYISAQVAPDSDNYLNAFAVDTNTEYRVRITNAEDTDIGARVRLVGNEGIYDSVTPDEEGNAVITEKSSIGFAIIKFIK